MIRDHSHINRRNTGNSDKASPLPSPALVTILPSEWQGYWVDGGVHDTHPEARYIGGQGRAQANSQQVPEVCNLLRHLT